MLIFVPAEYCYYYCSFIEYLVSGSLNLEI